MPYDDEYRTREQRRYYPDGEDRRANGGGGDAAYAIAAAIKWLGIVAVTIIIAYVVLRLTGTVESIFFTASG